MDFARLMAVLLLGCIAFTLVREMRNAAIAQRPFITEKAVSKHAAGIFGKLDLAPSDDDNRRVLAVLAYLDS
jgi:hypothetical protein